MRRRAGAGARLARGIGLVGGEFSKICLHPQLSGSGPLSARTAGLEPLGWLGWLDWLDTGLSLGSRTKVQQTPDDANTVWCKVNVYKRDNESVQLWFPQTLLPRICDSQKRYDTICWAQHTVHSVSRHKERTEISECRRGARYYNYVYNVNECPVANEWVDRDREVSRRERTRARVSLFSNQLSQWAGAGRLAAGGWRCQNSEHRRARVTSDGWRDLWTQPRAFWVIVPNGDKNKPDFRAKKIPTDKLLHTNSSNYHEGFQAIRLSGVLPRASTSRGEKCALNPKSGLHLHVLIFPEQYYLRSMYNSYQLLAPRLFSGIEYHYLAYI